MQFCNSIPGKRLCVSFQYYNKELLIFFQALSALLDFDLIIIVESQKLKESVQNSLYHRGRSINRVHIVVVDSIHDIYENILCGKGQASESIALLNNVARLTRNIIEQFQVVFVDIRAKTTPITLSLSSDLLEEGGLPEIVRKWFGNEDAEKVLKLFKTYKKKLCTLITSVYKSDRFLKSFIENSKGLVGYELIDHVFVVSELSEYEVSILLDLFKRGANQIFVWNSKDPGLYSCWNQGIQLATTEYISNANVDDFREPEHVDRLVNYLTNNSKYAFAASALYAFSDYGGNLSELRRKKCWYINEGGEIYFRTLGNVKSIGGNKFALEPHNLPHCMPVWRRELHRKYGYFDEESYGTYADWAYWLKVTAMGEVGYLIPEALGFYYINLESHNRRGEKLEKLHRRIEMEYLPYFLEEAKQKTNNMEFKSKTKINRYKINKKLDIVGADRSYGLHRNSFNKLIESLMPLHKGAGGVKFIPFIERYFVWGDKDGEARSVNPKSFDSDWIGILHVPFDSPSWFCPGNHPEQVFETKMWKESLRYCRGLIALSEDLAIDLREYFPDKPILILKHPAEINNIKQFNYDAYRENLKVVQVGDWLRDLQAIYRLSTDTHKKVLLLKENTISLLNQQKTLFGDQTNDSVQILKSVSNREYDELLSNSVVFCWLYATAANNLVVECIARNTPIIINPLPSVVEYLGEEYPLYMESIEEGSNKLMNEGLIKEAHSYLMVNKHIRESLTYEKFFEGFRTSTFYLNL